MLSLFANTVVAYLGFSVLFALIPPAKTALDYCVMAVLAFAMVRFLAGKLPVVCRCSHCGTTIVDARFEEIGGKVPCPDCLEHELHVPHKTLWQVVWQIFRRVGFGHELEDIAFDCPLFLKATSDDSRPDLDALGIELRARSASRHHDAGSTCIQESRRYNGS